ncbi:MAG: hypothetical protein AUG49_13550 [Catenulispora sp. 13_1_20CM_3_70_7]|nr:MAG: hypothetical protein AUG49_13550 [Catenulispora sp. 13_1_20CM_3_70_7]
MSNRTGPSSPVPEALHRHREARALAYRCAEAVGAGLEVPKYLRPSYHPSQHGSTQTALDYLAISTAAVYAAELAAARKDGAGSVPL